MNRKTFNAKGNEYMESLCREIQDLDKEVLLNAYIENNEEDRFTSYTNILIQIFKNIEHTETDLSAKQFQNLRRSIKFFYSHAWKYVALGVSERTAVGPSRRDMIKGAVNELDALEKNYARDLKSLRESCQEQDLLQTVPDNSVPVETTAGPSEITSEAVDAAYSDIKSQMESRDYSSIDPEQFTK
jgi:hypothetical protein